MPHWTIVLLAALIIAVPNTILAEDDGSSSLSRAAHEIQRTLVSTPYSPFPDRHLPWRWTFIPSGEAYGFQHTEKSRSSTYDYGARMNVQFGRGRGHAVWFGVAYRQAAGFDNNASITPFDPYHIDSAQLLTYRYQLPRQITLFSHWERWCYHEIDRRSPKNAFFTNATAGLGTVSPAEAWGHGPRRAALTGEPSLDGYLYAGPFIHGGPGGLLGNWPRWQGKGRAWAALAWPVTGVLVLEGQVWWETLLLRENEPDRWRHHADARISVMAQRDHGNVNLFAGHRLIDDWPYRTSPRSWYVGIGFRT